MSSGLYAADSCFGRDGRLGPRTRVVMLKELGYAGATACLGDERDWAELPELIGALDEQRLALAAVEVAGDVATGVIDPRLEELWRVLAGRSVLVELSLASSGEYDKPSAPRADARAADWVRRVVDGAINARLRVALSPRRGRWMARVEDAARLLMRINRAEVGMSFHLLDWLCVDGQHIQARLELVLPRLMHVSVCGATRKGANDWVVEPLGQGEFDTFGLLNALARMGYAGPVSLEGDGNGVEAEEKLRQSMAAWKKCARDMRA